MEKTSQPPAVPAISIERRGGGVGDGVVCLRLSAILIRSCGTTAPSSRKVVLVSGSVHSRVLV